MKTLDEQQNAALERAKQMVTEYFDGCLILAFKTSPDDPMLSVMKYARLAADWEALGLMERYKLRIASHALRDGDGSVDD